MMRTMFRHMLNPKRLPTGCVPGVICSLVLLGTVLLVLGMPPRAYAAAPGHTTTLQAGAYTIDVTLSQDPPLTDQPMTVTVAERNGASLLSGQAIVQPGLGTDGANVYATLHTMPGHPGTLQTTVRIPVRGAWQIVVKVTGTSGQGKGSVDVVAAAPGAMPVWLAWSIGALPALGLFFWTLRQRRFRRMLIFGQPRSTDGATSFTEQK
ncbi:MAG: heme exporter protein CcmD [Ktedonobacteraceae bacterium]|nr:heme exporter protein CcmD [Ktedonobacteraceae bacterium]